MIVLGDPRAVVRFKQNRGAVAGSALVLLLIGFALLGPLFAGHDPNLSDFAHGRAADGQLAGPSADHWLGVDQLFRDVFSRLAHGARVSLLVAFLATALSVAVGGAIGLASGYTQGTRWQALDTALMRFVDIGLSFPYLVLVLAIGAAVGETTIVTLLSVLGFTSWFGTARLIRSKTIQVRSLDFVLAARALGQNTPRVIVKHLLPNVLGPLIVVASASIANMIIAESVLSYLQVGLPPPRPTWGRMLYEAQPHYTLTPQLLVFPNVLILLAVLAFNLIRESVRDTLDPQED